MTRRALLPLAATMQAVGWTLIAITLTLTLLGSLPAYAAAPPPTDGGPWDLVLESPSPVEYVMPSPARPLGVCYEIYGMAGEYTCDVWDYSAGQSVLVTAGGCVEWNASWDCVHWHDPDVSLYLGAAPAASAASGALATEASALALLDVAYVLAGFGLFALLMHGVSFGRGFV